MTTNSFPSDPHSRRAILVLSQSDVEKCDYEPDAAQLLLDEEAYVLQFPAPQQGEVPIAFKNIIDAGLVRLGNLLVQSPFDPDEYAVADLAPQHFALAKHMYFSRLCQCLGAKTVNVEQVDLHTRMGKASVTAKGERLGSGGQVSVEDEKLENLLSHMTLLDEFPGGPPDIDAAERLLRQTGLWADPNMRALLELRRDGRECANQLQARKLVLNLSSETRSNLKVVGRLKVPAFMKLSAEYERVVNEKQDYTLTIEVRF